MAHEVRHAYVNPQVDLGDPNVAGPDEWNADHVVNLDMTLLEEEIQDIIGALFADSAEIDFTYNDAVPSISASIGAIAPSKITMNTGRLLGRSSAGAGAAEEISIGAGLTLVGGVLSSTITQYTDAMARAAVGGMTGFANPSVQVGLTMVPGSATTAMRSDAAPALSQAIVPTWTGMHTWSNVRTAHTGTWSPTGASNDYIHHYYDQIITPLGDENQSHFWLAPQFAPGSGRTIPTATVQQVILRTGNAAGTISNMAGIAISANYGTQKTTGGTTIGLQVNNIGTTGVGQTQAIGVKAQTGVGSFAVISEGGENRFVGPVVFNNLSSAVAPIQLTGTVNNLYGYLGEAAYPSGGGRITPIWVTSTLSPTTNLTYAIGIACSPLFSPPTGVTISEIWCYQATVYTGGAGAITKAVGYEAINGIGSGPKPSVVAGVEIQNMGVAGVGTAYGLIVQAQTGAITNIALASGGGSNIFVGALKIGAWALPAAALDVTGAGSFTAGLATTAGSGLTMYRPDNSNQFSISYPANDLFLAIRFNSGINLITVDNVGTLTVRGNVTTTTGAFVATGATYSTGASITGNLSVGGAGSIVVTASYTADVRSIYLAPTWTSTANHNLATGFDAILNINPAAGVTISTISPFEAAAVITGGAASAVTTSYGLLTTLILNTGSGTTITNHFGVYVNFSKTSGAVLNNHGIFVNNMGHAGSNNAIGIHIAAQAGSVNNYDMSFGTYDTAALGAYVGRIPILYGSAKRYIPVYA